MKNSTTYSVPNTSLVSNYIAKWNADPILVGNNKALDKLFAQVYPTNTAVEEVLVKVITLNCLFSTRVLDKDIQTVTACIVGIANMDARLKAGDISLVKELCRAFGQSKLKEYQSFASKYCAFHNPDAFPPYDRFVRFVLQQYCRQKVLKNIKITSLDDYNVYVYAIDQLKKQYGLNPNYRELDHWLWLMGKGVTLP